MVQRAMGGPELSIDCLGDRDGRCLNAIPRTMLESRGGESIKGTVVADAGADRARPARRWRRSACAARRRSRSSATPRSGSASPTSTRASAAPSRRPSTRRCPGRTYPELIVRMAARRARRAARRRVPRGDHVHALLLAARARRAAARRPAARSCPAARPRRAVEADAGAVESPQAGRIGREATSLVDRRQRRSRSEQAPPSGSTGAAERRSRSPRRPPPRRARCANCGAPMAAGQDWCLQCGAGAPGSLGARAAGARRRRRWPSLALLVLGAAAAAYAALQQRPRQGAAS